jgi:hypothetical protein
MEIMTTTISDYNLFVLSIPFLQRLNFTSNFVSSDGEDASDKM